MTPHWVDVVAHADTIAGWVWVALVWLAVSAAAAPIVGRALRQRNRMLPDRWPELDPAPPPWINDSRLYEHAHVSETKGRQQ